MTLTKKYLDNILLAVLCCAGFTGFAQNQKTYYAFDLKSTTLKLNNGRVELNSNGQIARGRYTIKGNELNIRDTLFNIKQLQLVKQVSYSPAISNSIKINVIRRSILSVVLISYRKGEMDFQTISDSGGYMKQDVDSFYFSFQGLDAKSRVYVLDNSTNNVITFRVPEKLENSISLGNEMAYLLMDGNKINITYYVNGRIQQKYLYTSKEALITDKLNRIKEFKKTGYWMD